MEQGQWKIEEIESLEKALKAQSDRIDAQIRKEGELGLPLPGIDRAIVVFKFSEGISRIVEEIGATVTSPRNSSAESLVRITTGLFLSGRENL